ncbi:MAG: hypothetical protein AAF614_31600 [Chloroflexota bacterium]
MTSFTSETLWQEVEKTAVIAGLDPTRFTDTHKEIASDIIAFLRASEQEKAKPIEKPSLASRLTRFFGGEPDPTPEPDPVPPIIISGEPGTGKTTFLYLLDLVLRTTFGLPDNLQQVMKKESGREYAVFKRLFCGHQTSLLSVRKWAGLLHFMTWDTRRHKLVREDLDGFIKTAVSPMRVIFTDEVEMVGYSPTIPDLARHGILVVGSSNQYEFEQLERELAPPKIYRFGGDDMRAGDPTDAIVTAETVGWERFEQLLAEDEREREQLTYRCGRENGVLFVLLGFETAVKAPLLETEWIQFFQIAYEEATGDTNPLQPQTPYILLFDSFSLAALHSDYNAIIRFVSLFDAIEQIGLGVFVRNTVKPPKLSREALHSMKVTIQNASGVPEEIKMKTAVGIDRLASRLGVAGYRAQQWQNQNA